MKIDISKIPGSYDGKECYVHARAGTIGGNKLIMTMQKLNVSGSDWFLPPVLLKSDDGGRTWTEPKPIAEATYTDDGTAHLCCDSTHLLHKKTGTAIICGHSVSYKPGSLTPVFGDSRCTCYFTYDIKNDICSEMKKIETPRDIYPKDCATGCSQFVETDDGDLLIPVYIPRDNRYNSGVMRCSYDGETVKYKEMSNELSLDVARGLYEGSLCRFNDKYYLTLRNDECGYWSVSTDGRTFEKQQPWRWDTGDILPNYNTQQHWLR